MRIRLEAITRVLIAWVIVCLSQARAQPPARIAILEPGIFHAGEVVARNGETWFGVEPTIVRKQTISVRRVNDIVVDDPAQKTGIEVTVPGATPMFLVKNVKFRAQDATGSAPVQTSFFKNEGISLASREPRKLRLANKEYTLLVADVAGRGSRLLLESGGVSQILYQWPAKLEDERCELLWAGDLDGDAKLDLYIYVSSHYAATEHTLLLSGSAIGPKLVNVAAIWRTSGS
jgi:hypothetical protein